ncbi:MAG: hypothetical protein JRI95_03235 [Deltaproteobacteria bacterium]|nr:hypothetical protein [Deltaproteobacteria bacterium]
MGQLFKQTIDGLTLWNTGAAQYFFNYKHGPSRLLVAVQCRLGNLPERELALLDTGAEWSVIGGEIAELLEDQLGSAVGSLEMTTRHGLLKGDLYTLNISLLAKPDWGCDLEVEGRVFISHEWPGPVVLGYCGFLEQLRFGLDPGVAPGNQIIYFGPID